MVKKNLTLKPDINAAYVLKGDLPDSREWGDVISLFLLCLSAIGLLKKHLLFGWISIFGLVSLLINRRYGKHMVFFQIFAILCFVLFIVFFQYHTILTGLQSYF